MENTIGFAKRLKELRTELGLSQRGLAREVGLSPSAIKQWESLDRVPNALALMKLSKFFKVSVDYLLGLVD